MEMLLCEVLDPTMLILATSQQISFFSQTSAIFLSSWVTLLSLTTHRILITQLYHRIAFPWQLEFQ